MLISKILYQTLCVFSQIKDRKHIEHNFHPVAGVMPHGWDLGVLEVGGGGGGNFRVGICDGVPSTVHSSWILLLTEIEFKLHLLKNYFYNHF